MTDDRKPSPQMEDLFAAGRSESPPSDGKAKALEKLGLAALPLAAKTSAPTAATSGSTAAAGAGVGTKIVGLVVVIGAAFGGGVFVGRSGQSPSAAPPAVTPVPAPAPPQEPEPIAAPPTTPPTAPAEKTAAPPQAPERRASPIAPKPKADDADALEEELATLDTARTHLNAGDTTKALAAIRAYEKAFPTGQLAPDAALLKIEALMKAGQPDEARRAADRLRATNPSGLIRDRLQRLLEPHSTP